MHYSCGRKSPHPVVAYDWTNTCRNSSVAALLAAFSFHFFLGTTTVTRAIVGTIGGIVAGLVVWLVIHAWDTSPESNARPHQPTSDHRSTNSVSNFGNSVSTLGEKLREISFEMAPRINIRRATRKSTGSDTLVHSGV